MVMNEEPHLGNCGKFLLSKYTACGLVRINSQPFITLSPVMYIRV